MGKFDLDIDKLDNAASKLRAIAHPVRIAIIGLLEEKEKMNVTQIHTKLKIGQATASHHLNLLKSKGVLISRRDGKNTYYAIAQDSLLRVMECIDKCNQ